MKLHLIFATVIVAIISETIAQQYCVGKDGRCQESWECCSNLCRAGSCIGDKGSCIARGGFCQNHWECCSKSCMSYIHKCVGQDRNEPYRPTIFYPWNAQDAAQWEEIFRPKPVRPQQTIYDPWNSMNENEAQWNELIQNVVRPRQ